jgi:hypothetical protein
MRWRTTCFVALVLQTGCYGAPTPEQISNANYGSYPFAYKEIVKAFYANLPKDPDSMRYQSISPPVRSWWWGDLIFGVKYGYLVCVTKSAKEERQPLTQGSTNAGIDANTFVAITTSTGLASEVASGSLHRPICLRHVTNDEFDILPEH